jgi:hypothetical protein
MKNLRVLALLNTLGFIITLTLNGLANALPINGKNTGELSDMYPNLFVPAGFTFSIWGVIYTFLLLFIGYQLFQAFSKNQRHDSFINEIGGIFFLNCLANASWIVAWHYQYVGLALLIMFAILATLILIYQKLKIGLTKVRTAEKWLVHIPFSLYLGWITVATIANVTTLLVDLDWNGFGIAPEIWTVIVLIVGTLIGLRVLQKRGDLAFGVVILWAYFGIISKRMSEGAEFTNAIVLTAIVSMVLFAVAIVRRFVK